MNRMNRITIGRWKNIRIVVKFQANLVILIISRVSLESLIVSKRETFLETFIPEIGSNVNQPRYPMCPLFEPSYTHFDAERFPRLSTQFHKNHRLTMTRLDATNRHVLFRPRHRDRVKGSPSPFIDTSLTAIDGKHASVVNTKAKESWYFALPDEIAKRRLIIRAPNHRVIAVRYRG